MERLRGFVEEHRKPIAPYSREPYIGDVKAGKNSPIYNAHSYHTKVPPEGIEPFIKHYTEEGDLVLDPFCGSGMTGVAALRSGRIPILIDLSPAATFIAYNYCTPVDAGKFETESKRILDKVRKEMDWLYETRCRRCGSKAVVEYIIWSDEFECPRCGERFLLWDVALDDGKVNRNFTCPQCKKELKKQDCKRTDSKPVKVNYTCSRCKRREDDVSEFDLERIKEIERRWRRIYDEKLPPDSDGFWPLKEDEKPLWFPSCKMPDGYNTRQPRISHGITHVHQFYTTRNLWALARLWDEINGVENDVKEMLMFGFTSINPYVCKKQSYRGGGGGVSGTLYIPSLQMEKNVLAVIKRKYKKLQPLFKDISRNRHPFFISTQSATDLSNIPSDSIDYSFTDPPFGGNLMYSELNFLWEAWLGVFTDNKDEAIVNKTQGKGVKEYEELMSASVKEIYRVLKPGRWMTMVFHNSSDAVWQAIQNALNKAGFVIATIGTFDKKQKSFKQVTSTGAVGYDLTINCYKPEINVKNGINGKTTKEAIVDFLKEYMRNLPDNDERSERMLYSKTLGFFMSHGRSLEGLSYDAFREILEDYFKEIDSLWYLPFQLPSNRKNWFGIISNERDAIGWLEDFLAIPKTYGEIAPEFFRSLGGNTLKKDLRQILEENFIHERDRWRNPTPDERDRLIDLEISKTKREIDSFLKGDREVSGRGLCEWVKFCYDNGLYDTGIKIFELIDENSVDKELYKQTKMIADICKMKIRS